MPSTHSILLAISSTNSITWSQFIRNLPDKPVAFVDKGSWVELLQSVGALNDMELIVVERDRNTNDILLLALTELGQEQGHPARPEYRRGHPQGDGQKAWPKQTEGRSANDHPRL